MLSQFLHLSKAPTRGVSFCHAPVVGENKKGLGDCRGGEEEVRHVCIRVLSHFCDLKDTEGSAGASNELRVVDGDGGGDSSGARDGNSSGRGEVRKESGRIRVGGNVYFQCVCGYNGKDEDSAWNQILAGNCRQLGGVRPHCDPALEPLCVRIFRKRVSSLLEEMRAD